MKLIGTEKNQLLLQFGRRERELLQTLLQLYPRVPPRHHKLTRSAALDPANQQLLDEALAEHRADNHKHLAALLTDPRRWSEHHNGWRLSLSSSETEWLLQVLNDIRVGSWVLLGSPEEHLEVLDEKTAPHVWAMEIAGSFQMALLHLLEGLP